MRLLYLLLLFLLGPVDQSLHHFLPGQLGLLFLLLLVDLLLRHFQLDLWRQLLHSNQWLPLGH